MEQVSHPSEVEAVPGQPWTKRLKYVAVGELIAEYEQSNLWIGRTVCPVLDYLRSHADAALEDVEDYIYGHRYWGPAVLCETMRRAPLFNQGEHGAFVAAWVQHFCALRLAAHRFGDARVALADMLAHPETSLAGPAAYVVLAYLNAHHPNPRRLLEKPGIAEKFPGLDIAAFAAPDFD